MIQVTVITVGTLKEAYWRDALAEYEKRLGAFCSYRAVHLKEERLSDHPSQKEIDAALENEGKRMLAAIPPRAYCIALCVEGKQFSSEGLAKKLEEVSAQRGALCLLIGSSFGLSPTVKAASDLQLSVSELTFPHQMMQVLLLEVLYRCFGILKGTKYHK